MNLQTLTLISGAASVTTLAVVASAAAVTPEPPTDYQGLAVIITALTLASASVVSSALAVATFIVARKSAKDVTEVKKMGIVTHDLVNSLSEKKDAALGRAAFLEGKEVGTDKERAAAAAVVAGPQGPVQPVVIEEVKPAAVADIAAVVTKEITPPTKQD